MRQDTVSLYLGKEEVGGRGNEKRHAILRRGKLSLPLYLGRAHPITSSTFAFLHDRGEYGRCGPWTEPRGVGFVMPRDWQTISLAGGNADRGDRQEETGGELHA